MNYIRQYQIDHDVAAANAYDFTMYLMAGLLVVGFVCNLFVGRASRGTMLNPADAPASWRRRRPDRPGAMRHDHGATYNADAGPD